ncbi:hypothetical protein PR001_g13432 [Phytophthora rubi]|uniref:Uncharacterized protein n=3 Tax=Phytophthora rubi TaxID=129364 RepID=A0A6A3LY46_9STRA|nr:hypothetical protein PR001_g13432 [Phytophthora rubi]
MISYSTMISEAHRVVNIPNPRGKTKYTGNTTIAKVGSTSATEPPGRFVTLIQGQGAYARVSADAPIQVEFIAEGCPEYHTTFKLDWCIHKAMKDYYLGASCGKSELKELLFNEGPINDTSPLAKIFLSKTIDYKGRIWMGAFVQRARRLMASHTPSTPTGSLFTQDQVGAVSTTAVSSPGLPAQDDSADSDDDNPVLLTAEQYSELRGERVGPGHQQQAANTDGLKQFMSLQFDVIHRKLPAW